MVEKKAEVGRRVPQAAGCEPLRQESAWGMNTERLSSAGQQDTDLNKDTD